MENAKRSRTRRRAVDVSTKELNTISFAAVQELREKTTALLSDYLVIRETFLDGEYLGPEHQISKAFGDLNLDNGKELVRRALKVVELMKRVNSREEGETVLSGAIRKQGKGKGKNRSSVSQKIELELYAAELRNFEEARENLQRLCKYLEDHHSNTSDPYQLYSMHLRLKLVGHELLLQELPAVKEKVPRVPQAPSRTMPPRGAKRVAEEVSFSEDGPERELLKQSSVGLRASTRRQSRRNARPVVVLRASKLDLDSQQSD
ncbi:unnamed protein product [Sphagnum balticum]